MFSNFKDVEKSKYNNLMTKMNMNNKQQLVNCHDEKKQEIIKLDKTISNLEKKLLKSKMNNINNIDIINEIDDLKINRDKIDVDFDDIDFYINKFNNNNDIDDKKQLYDKCIKCNNNVMFFSDDGYLSCSNCGNSNLNICELEKVNFKEYVYDNKNAGYKMMNHFSELLNQFQAKESTEIPSIVYDTIKNELNKMKIFNPKIINKSLIRQILKKTNLNSYYEHIPFIINKLTGFPPPSINRATEEVLKYMFKTIQEPYKKYKNKTRKNFLSYNFIFRKFFELLEFNHFLHFFPVLKAIDVLREHDIIWQKICNDLKWKYIPSI